MQRVKPASALNQQVEIFSASQRIFDHVKQVRRRMLGKVLHGRWKTNTNVKHHLQLLVENWLIDWRRQLWGTEVRGPSLDFQ